jgi:hypothetical protein
MPIYDLSESMKCKKVHRLSETYELAKVFANFQTRRAFYKNAPAKDFYPCKKQRRAEAIVILF